MENITCKGCQATVDKNLEFCSSCGEWLGLKLEDIENDSFVETNSSEINRMRIPKIKCSNCGNANLPSVKNCKECNLPLVKPLSNYGATNLPTRKDVPGIRAVFFLALIIPLIAGASFFYNDRVADEVIQEISVIEQTTVTSTSTTIQSNLKPQIPVSCMASSTFNDDFSCENLYDDSNSMWQDNELSCEDATIEFTFANPIYFEFIVFQNAEKSSSFIRNFKARDIRITTDQNDFVVDKELENDNYQQWIDLNTDATKIKIEILSSFPGEELNGQNPFTECAIQEIKFFGKS